VWPVACLAYHYLLSRAYNKPEKGLLKVAKILLLIVYLVSLIVSQKIKTTAVRYWVVIMMISLPIISAIYT